MDTTVSGDTEPRPQADLVKDDDSFRRSADAFVFVTHQRHVCVTSVTSAYDALQFLSIHGTDIIRVARYIRLKE